MGASPSFLRALLKLRPAVTAVIGIVIAAGVLEPDEDDSKRSHEPSQPLPAEE